MAGRKVEFSSRVPDIFTCQKVIQLPLLTVCVSEFELELAELGIIPEAAGVIRRSYREVFTLMEKDTGNRVTDRKTKGVKHPEPKQRYLVANPHNNRVPNVSASTAACEQAFSQDWIKNAEQRYFISTFEASYDEAKQHCLKYHSNLLEIISEEEKKFVTKAVQDQSSSYWIGKCQDGKVATKVVYHMNAGKFKCSECKWYSPLYHCNRDNHRFICESSAPLCPDNSEMIQDVCQQPVG
ncbi:uncharacterized protein LOC132387481 [Hypanus sabinus]|uniref:uncharacterized protein LOC132387273 n=1 Tax=Hypanus sabinus TaxID=79690 RepID=UPI0028C3882D|nr:uncharacterized protein LOC132387273 [Hypanus sabinus]XP_059815833.1 uncharacterized protein LOC132387481 [Hypanus sabinus]